MLTPNSSFSVAIDLRLPNQPGMLARVIQAIASVQGSLGTIDLVQQTNHHTVRRLVVNAVSYDHGQRIIAAVSQVDDVEVLQSLDRTFDLHEGGKITVNAKRDLQTAADLAMAYTPGVGRVSMAIAEDPTAVYRYTIKGNTIGIVTDGSAVLGLGNIGPEAALPVMEGKAMLFKKFAGLDAFPLCLATQDVDAIVETVVRLAPGFGGFNLEDISAPRCFEIEARLKERLAMPIFHDDQHGTAIVVLAALFNALRCVHQSLADVHIVLNGAGAAGIAVIQLLKLAGAQRITACDSKGIVSTQRSDLTPEKIAIAVPQSGSLADALVGADVFIGVSVAKALSVEMVETMAPSRIIFALANPIPEIQPELVTDRVAIMATGRSDYPNQINNVLAFPGVFRGALDCQARSITPGMCLAAAKAIAALLTPDEINPQLIIPSVFDPRVAPAVATAVAQAAAQQGLAKA